MAQHGLECCNTFTEFHISRVSHVEKLSFKAYKNIIIICNKNNFIQN